MAFLLLIFLVLILSGCGKKGEKKKEGKVVTLYYLNNAENGLEPVLYTLSHTKGTKSQIKEILYALADTESDDSGNYKASIYDGVIIKTAELTKKALTIDFESNYSQLSADKEILLRSSVVKSLVQLDGVKSVTFTVAGNSLIGSDGKAYGAMTDDSFLQKRSEVYSRKEKVTLYFSNSKGDKLVKVNREIKVSENVPIEMGMLNELIRGKVPKGAKNPLPADLTINRTQVYNNICYVDLGSEIEEILPDVEDKIKVYSMVNTLVDRGYASQVQFTVNGKPLPKLNDVENFDQPLSSDYSLAEEKKSEDSGKKKKSKEKKSKKKSKEKK